MFGALELLGALGAVGAFGVLGVARAVGVAVMFVSRPVRPQGLRYFADGDKIPAPEACQTGRTVSTPCRFSVSRIAGSAVTVFRWELAAL